MEKITESQLQEIVYKSVKKILSESNFFDTAKQKIADFGEKVVNKMDGYRDGAPKTIKDVIEGNGWGITVERMQTTPNGKEITIFKNPHGHSLTPKELVEDINIFLQDRQYNMKALITYDKDYYYKLILKKF